MQENELKPLPLPDYDRLNLEETGTAMILRKLPLTYGAEYHVGSPWVTAVVLGSTVVDGGVLVSVVAVRS